MVPYFRRALHLCIAQEIDSKNYELEPFWHTHIKEIMEHILLTTDRLVMLMSGLVRVYINQIEN